MKLRTPSALPADSRAQLAAIGRATRAARSWRAIRRAAMSDSPRPITLREAVHTVIDVRDGRTRTGYDEMSEFARPLTLIRAAIVLVASAVVALFLPVHPEGPSS